MTRRDIRERVELVGRLLPRADVTTRSRSRGYITAMPFDVETGLEDDGYAEILSGLDPEDQVVTLGSNLPEDGQLVTPLEPRGDPRSATANGEMAAPPSPPHRDGVPHVGR